MAAYSLSHLSDSDLLGSTSEMAARDCSTTAGLLAHLAEIDTRKLYLPAAYPSMFAYCVHELHMSEDSALKRIQAARTARQFPAVFDVVADGRLHLTGLRLLAPHLTTENMDELLKAAAHKTKAEIELLLAQRFPRTELLPLVETLPELEHAPGHVAATGRAGAVGAQHAPAHVEAPAPRAKMSPIACQRFGLQVSVGQDTHDKLRYAQALFSHQIPAGDVARLFDRALDALIREGEKGKFAATAQPQRKQRPTTSPRHIPAHVKRAVWERDHGQCTFVSEAGRCCTSRTLLEFDHIDSVALGGEATVDRMRLRCRAHNQYAAECTFGTEFMSNKRHDARQAAEARKVDATQRARAAAEQDRERDVIPWLRQLGFSVSEARDAAEHCAHMLDATLEERVRAALSYFHPRARTSAPAVRRWPALPGDGCRFRGEG